MAYLTSPGTPFCNSYCNCLGQGCPLSKRSFSVGLSRWPGASEQLQIFLENLAILQLRIVEEPLTAYNLATILSSFTELHTKCWLIERGRFADLMDYTQTHQPRFAEEAGLIVIQIYNNSPVVIILALGKLIADVFVKTFTTLAHVPERTIDALMQATDRKQAKQEDNEYIKRKHELELSEQEFAFKTKQFDWALEKALYMAKALNPEADPQTQAMAARTFIPQLILLGETKSWEATLLPGPEKIGDNPPKEEKEEKT